MLQDYNAFMAWLPREVSEEILARGENWRNVYTSWHEWWVYGRERSIQGPVTRAYNRGEMFLFDPVLHWPRWHQRYVDLDPDLPPPGPHGRNPGDRGLRGHERMAAASGTVEDLVRLAHERRRRGEGVSPWELVPLSYTFLDAYKDLAKHYKPGGLQAGKPIPKVTGRVEAQRKPENITWVASDGLPPTERFYVAPSAYPLYPPEHPGYDGSQSGRGQQAELVAHMDALEEWRALGAIVVRLDFSSRGKDIEHACGTRGNEDGQGGCSYCNWLGAYEWRVLTHVPDVRNALSQSGWWSSGNSHVLIPTNWERARIMKRVGNRWKNNPVRARRELRITLPRSLHPAKTVVLPIRSNPVLPCSDPHCMCAGRGHACAGCGGSDRESCSCGRCDRCRALVRGRGGHAPLYVTEDDEVLCGRCYDND